jgi:DNA-binding response OmpR family regulator
VARQAGSQFGACLPAFCDSHSRREALEAGCVEYVEKPVNFEVLDGVLRRHLHIH